MTSTQKNPRRSYKIGGHPTFTSCQPSSAYHPCQKPSVESNLPLRKSSTFHSPTSPSSDDDPVLSIPQLARRSPTCHKDLEDAVAAGERRIQQFLGVVDRSLSGLASFSSDSQETLRQDDLPVPRWMLGTHTGGPDCMDIDDSLNHISPSKPQQRAARNHHTSDSGIGSSVSSIEESLSGDHAARNPSDYKQTIPSKVTGIQSGINGYAPSNVDASTRMQHVLSEYACAQIQKLIIKPIINETRLKAFHPLVSSIPHRVGQKQITCLRDLEKVILWLAPVSGSYQVWERSLAHTLALGVKKYSVSKLSFLNFCETSIQCLHTTVQHLNEPDQRRPSDKPYTNGYFLDLTAQVRQYAAMITEVKQRTATGIVKEEADYASYVCVTDDGELLTLNIISDERLALHGGLGKTGRPAELVRIKNGQGISLRTGEPISLETSLSGSNRSGSGEANDDLALSMARRKQSEQAAAKQIQRCSECSKEFKRPCDLTKHEKTHSRPWKCNEPTCKYSQFGWPTEKERDRHVNDKHSVTPNMYKCQFGPCPYESKRESNCKQHMEKAHGWAYHRSKNNGKNGKKVSKVGNTPPTPQITTPGSYIFDASGSEFGEPSSPYLRNFSVAPSANGSSRGEGSSHLSNLESPYLGVNETFAQFDPSFAWDGQYNRLTPNTPYTPSSGRLSVDSLTNASTIPSSYAMEDPPLFNGTFDWSNTDFTSMNIQIDTTTPMGTIETRSLDAYSRNPSISLDQVQNAKYSNLSPGAQGNQTLYSPYADEDVDEGYSEFPNAGKPAADFALFDSRPPSSLGGVGSMNLFSELPPFMPTTWSGRGTDLGQQLGMNEMMQLDEE